MVEHRKNLIMNLVRDTLEKLRATGVGYIDAEYTNEIHYMIDGKVLVIEIKDGDGNG